VEARVPAYARFAVGLGGEWAGLFGGAGRQQPRSGSVVVGSSRGILYGAVYEKGTVPPASSTQTHFKVKRQKTLEHLNLSTHPHTHMHYRVSIAAEPKVGR
jgi:hypothetical protein